MKKILLSLLLLTSLPVCAQGWVRYADNDAGTMYFDSLRTRKMGDTAFVWDLHDLKAGAKDEAGLSYRSTLYATEYNCRSRQRRVLSAARYAEPMGKGSISSEISMVSAWSEALPDSLPGQLFNHICE